MIPYPKSSIKISTKNLLLDGYLNTHNFKSKLQVLPNRPFFENVKRVPQCHEEREELYTTEKGIIWTILSRDAVS